MSDGGDRGVTAQRALDTVLGGKADPTACEELDRAGMRALVMQAPLPGEREPSSYDEAARSVAKAMLFVHEAGTPLDGDAMWAAVKARWDGFDKWLGGCTGFMFGWAVNCVRWINEQPPVPNPAIIQVG